MPGPNNPRKMEAAADTVMTDASAAATETPAAQGLSSGDMPHDVLGVIGGFLAADAARAQSEQLRPAVAPQESSAGAAARVSSAGAGASAVAAETSTSTPTSTNDSLQALKTLSETSRDMRSIFQPMVKEQEITRLVTLVLHGRKAQAEAMIKRNPSLLRARAPLAQYQVGAGNTRDFRNVTAYEAALYSADVCGNEGGHEEMVEMMHRYFAQMEGGEAERQTQYQNVFPEGVEALVAQQEADAEIFRRDILQPIINAIDTASDADVKKQLEHKTVIEDNNTPLARAFETFREDFNNISLAEKHENLNYLMEVFNAFAEDGNEINQWWQAAERSRNYEKLDLYWCMVIGYLQAVSLAENTKQVFYQGLEDYVHNRPMPSNERLVRFRYGAGTLSFQVGFLGCGFEYAGRERGPWGRLARARGGAWLSMRLRWRASDLFRNLCQTKTGKCGSYAEAAAHCTQAIRDCVR